MKIILLLAIALVTFASAATLEELQTSFMARYDEANAKRDEQLKKLEGSYLGALERHLKKVSSGGKLEEVIPVRDELEAVRASKDPLPELPDSADYTLKQMRGKYVDARGKVLESHAETLVDLSDKMNTALEAQERELTRAGKIDEALAAKRMRETLSEDKGLQAAQGVVASNTKPSGLAKSEWRSLLGEKMEVVSKGRHPVGKLSDIVADQGPSAIKLMAGGTATDPEKVLVSPSPCRLRFKPVPAVTQVRGTVSLVHPKGSVICRVIVAGEKVYEKLLGGEERTDRFDVEVTSGSAIELEVDERGHSGNDWVIWTGLDAR